MTSPKAYVKFYAIFLKFFANIFILFIIPAKGGESKFQNRSKEKDEPGGKPSQMSSQAPKGDGDLIFNRFL